MTDQAAARDTAPPRTWRLAAPAGGLGALFALGQAPYDLWPVALAALFAQVWLLRRIAVPARARAAAWTGWAFGAGYFALGMHWIVEPFFVEAAVTGWMAPFALVGLAAGLALFWAAPAWAAARAGSWALVVPLWALAELARAYVLTGFPWGLVGYVWTPSPGAQWAAIIGPHGLTLAALGLAALAASAVARRSVLRGSGALVLAVAMLGGGLLLRPAPGDLSDRPVVRLVQPNAPQDEKWRPELIPMFFQRQMAATEAEPQPDLVLWSETALPMMLDNADEAFSIMSEAAGDVPLVVGLQREEGGRYYNSAAVLGPGGAVQDVYDKHHLVPFGEYMPAAWLFRHINVSGLAARAEGGYSAGPGPRLLDLGALGQALPLICYEAVFPQDVNGAPARPDVLVNLTNDAWFGTWSGPYQHLAQARMRAIEQGLPMLRAANTGISAVIDPGGRVLAELPLGEAGHIDHALPLPAERTFYSHTGDLPALLAMLALALATALWHIVMRGRVRP